MSPEVSSTPSTPAVADGQPTIILQTISIYHWLWSSKGSGADECTISRPVLTQPGFWILGDHANNFYGPGTGPTIVATTRNDVANDPLIKAPVDWAEVWTDKGSGGDHKGAVWFPVAPDGYVALGYVVTNGYSKPQGVTYGCLRMDQVQESTVTGVIWTDRKSGARKHVSLFSVEGATGLFVAQPNYKDWTGTAFRPHPQP